MKVTAKAPVNIALLKYWGKEDEKNIIPYNSSISLTLDNLYTVTTIESSNIGFNFSLNGKILKDESSNKVYEFLKNFASTSEIEQVNVKSRNFVPTAAGLASSASAFAALSLAANKYFKKDLSLEQLSYITRKGSGSACRSLFGGFVAWEKTGDVYQIPTSLKGIVMISVIVDSNKKQISSRNAMAKSVLTSPMYNYFVEESNKDFSIMLNAIKNNDLNLIGELTKKSALMLHAVMLATTPPVIYLQSRSIEVINIVNNLNSKGLYAYPTMDAGANIKILTLEEDYQKIIKQLEEKGFIDYYISRPGKGATIIDEKLC